MPLPGKYYKVIDTDATEFGGNGHNWINEYEAVPHPAFHHPNSICTNLLPLHGMLFRFAPSASSYWRTSSILTRKKRINHRVTADAEKSSPQRTQKCREE